VDDVRVNQLSETEKTTIRQKKIGFVFQAFRLFHSLSAIDNVALGFELRDPKQPQRLEMARQLLEQFGLGGKCNQEPNELSRAKGNGSPSQEHSLGTLPFFSQMSRRHLSMLNPEGISVKFLGTKLTNIEELLWS